MVTTSSPLRRGIAFSVITLALFLSFTITGASASVIVSHYSFNTTSGMEYKDSTGKYNLTNSGGTTTASGKLGTGFYADATGDCVNITNPSALFGISAFTISGWVQRQGASGSTQYVFYGGENNKAFGLPIYTGNTVYGIVHRGDALAYGSYGYTPGTSNYHHYVLVFNGSAATNTTRLKLYINGTEKALGSFFKSIPTVTPTPVTNTFTIGGRTSGGGLGTGTGYFDEVTIFNASLTAANISWLWNSGNARPYNVILAAFGSAGEPDSGNFSVTAKNGYTGSSLTNFNVTINGITYNDAGLTVTTDLLRADKTLEDVTISKAGFATRIEYDHNITNNLQVRLYPENSLSVFAYYTNGSRIYTFTTRIYNLTNQTTKTTTIGYANFTNLGPGSWNVEVNKTGAAKGYYTVTMGDTHQELTAYLVKNTTSLLNTTFTVKDKLTGNYLEGAVVNQYQLVAGTLTLINSHSTDITGGVLVRYAASTLYKFEISKSTYTTKNFYLQPSSTSYIILLDKASTFNPDIISNDVSVTIQDYLMKQKNLSWVTVSFSSSEGSLTGYAVSLLSDNNQTLTTGNNAYGSILNATIRENTGQTVIVRFCYNSTLNTGENCGNVVYRLQRVQNNLYNEIRTDSAGLEVGEKALIATFVTILIAGALAIAFGLIGAAGIGAAIGGLVGMSVFYAAGFIGWWSLLLTFIILVMFIVNRVGADG